MQYQIKKLNLEVDSHLEALEMLYVPFVALGRELGVFEPDKIAMSKNPTAQVEHPENKERLVSFLALQASIAKALEAYKLAESNLLVQHKKIKTELDQEVKKLLDMESKPPLLAAILTETKEETEQLMSEKSSLYAENRTLELHKKSLKKGQHGDLASVNLKISNNVASMDRLDSQIRTIQEQAVLDAVHMQNSLNPKIIQLEREVADGKEFLDVKARYEQISRYGAMGTYNSLSFGVAQKLLKTIELSPSEQQQFNQNVAQNDSLLKSHYLEYLKHTKTITRHNTDTITIDALREIYLNKQQKQVHLKELFPDFVAQLIGENDYLKAKSRSNIFSTTHDEIEKFSAFLKKEFTGGEEKNKQYIQKAMANLGVELSVEQVNSIYIKAKEQHNPVIHKTIDIPSVTRSSELEVSQSRTQSQLMDNDESALDNPTIKEQLRNLFAAYNKTQEKMTLKIFNQQLRDVKQLISDDVLNKIDNLPQQDGASSVKKELIEHIRADFKQFQRTLSPADSLAQTEAKLNQFTDRLDQYLQLKSANIQEEIAQDSALTNQKGSTTEFVSQFKAALQSIKDNFEQHKKVTQDVEMDAPTEANHSQMKLG